MSPNKNFYVLTFRVKPNKSETKITEKHNNFYDIELAAPPVDDKANIELISFVSKEFSVPKSSIEFMSGRTSKIKRLKIYG